MPTVNEGAPGPPTPISVMPPKVSRESTPGRFWSVTSPISLKSRSGFLPMVMPLRSTRNTSANSNRFGGNRNVNSVPWPILTGFRSSNSQLIPENSSESGPTSPAECPRAGWKATEPVMRPSDSHLLAAVFQLVPRWTWLRRNRQKSASSRNSMMPVMSNEPSTRSDCVAGSWAIATRNVPVASSK